MISKHTPGPWRVAEGSFPGCLHVQGPPQPITIITTALDIDLAGSWESEANAHLIAAAPELLDALQAMVTSYEHEASMSNPALESARAAIAKATGEQA